jgi:hypothetical protein
MTTPTLVSSAEFVGSVERSASLPACLAGGSANPTGTEAGGYPGQISNPLQSATNT